ncbi:hypothetical protein HOLleu_24500 [Holothuria leucospilota]|uniref:Uncharacterized protein n=1 Tax=Holothuria leucospilota TaxID=206669 RepID=A0A9Q1BWU5_HOLLE|nr:hypothetical protein HOLleu_24500 [Holothuria leucospilota]
MSVYSVIDIWGEINPFGKHYTWGSNITPDIHCRLDYFLISHHLRPPVHSVHFSLGLQSDHCFCILVIIPVQMTRGPGIWKFDNSLLDGTIYVSNMKNCIIDSLKEVGSHNPAVSWEFVKCKIRKFSMVYSKEKAKLRRRREYELLKIISTLEHQLLFNPSVAVSFQLKKANLELLDYYHDFKLRGTITRSKARWVEDGEKNKTFLNTLPDYKSIPGCDLSVCEGELTLEERSAALHSITNDKSPGSDGLSTNFYKTFWHLIGSHVVSSLN